MKFVYAFLLSLIGLTAWGQYVPDILGGDYLKRTIHMPNDYSGEVVCTLVKKPEMENTQKAVLYIHGYNDYFFQKELGDSIQAQGYNFYAMDLRKYGRSILPNQDPFFCKSVTEYFADLDTALALIQQAGNDTIFLMAHSTGGLTTSHYLQEKQNEVPVAGLILNSPFLEWNFGWAMRKIVMPVVSFIGRFFPYLTVQGYGDASYAESLLKQYHGEWSYNTDWKMIHGHPKKAGWIKAIQEAQQEVQKKSDLPCPALVLSSNKSFPETATWNNAYMTSDIVLNVDDIQKYGAQLGYSVTCDSIKNGIHDLILSEKPSRDTAYETIASWLKKITFSTK